MKPILRFIVLVTFSATQAAVVVRLQQRQRLDALFAHQFQTLCPTAQLIVPAANLQTGSLWHCDDSDTHAAQRAPCVRDVLVDVVHSPSARTLVDAVRSSSTSSAANPESHRAWLLEYDVLAPPAATKERVASKQLLCALAQAFPHPPALTAAEVQTTFSIFETADALYFGRKVPTPGRDAAEADAALWVRRPFVFSAALSVELAQAVVTLLAGQLLAQGGPGPGPASTPPTLFDPCCGSGTTLFAAARAGFRVLGSDVNVDFARGTRDNLVTHAGAGDALHGLFVKDAAQAALPWRPLDASAAVSPVAAADAVFCNFPWNERVGQYHGEVSQILAALAQEMRPGCRCAFVTKQPLLTEALRGYEVTAVVDVNGNGNGNGGPRAFMDTGRKGGGQQGAGDDAYVVGKKVAVGDCMITFCTRLN